MVCAEGQDALPTRVIKVNDNAGVVLKATWGRRSIISGSSRRSQFVYPLVSAQIGNRAISLCQLT